MKQEQHGSVMKKVFGYSLTIRKSQEDQPVPWSENSWLVYDPVTNNTFLLEDYNNKSLNQIYPAKVLGNTSDAWWRLDSNYYYLYVKGKFIATRTKRFTFDNNLLVYDEPTNTTYIFKDYTNSADNQFRPAVNIRQMLVCLNITDYIYRYNSKK